MPGQPINAEVVSIESATGQSPGRFGDLRARDHKLVAMMANGITMARAAENLGITLDTAIEDTERLIGEMAARAASPKIVRGRQLLQVEELRQKCMTRLAGLEAKWNIQSKAFNAVAGNDNLPLYVRAGQMANGMEAEQKCVASMCSILNQIDKLNDREFKLVGLDKQPIDVPAISTPADAESKISYLLDKARARQKQLGSGDDTNTDD